MKLLLDTHILIWLFENNKQLSDTARELIMNKDNEIYYSALAIFEIITKSPRNARGQIFLQRYLSGQKVGDFVGKVGGIIGHDAFNQQRQ